MVFQLRQRGRGVGGGGEGKWCLMGSSDIELKEEENKKMIKNVKIGRRNDFYE